MCTLGTLPGAARVLDRVADALVQRRSVLLVVPRGVSSRDVWDEVTQRLYVRRILYTACDAWPRSLRDIGQAVGALATDGTPTIDETVRQVDGCDVIAFPRDGADDLPAETAPLLDDWAGAGRSGQGERRVPAYFGVVSGAQAISRLPRSDVNAAVVWWHEGESILDVRVRCRERGRALGDRFVALWREQVVPDVAGTDLDLADRIWEHVEEPEENLLRVLEDCARERGWKRDCLARLRPCLEGPRGIHPFAADRVDSSLAPAWAEGLVQCSPEYGLEVNSAAMAIDPGLRHALLHRWWRGQQALLTPLVDGIRRRVCSLLTRRYGSQWPLAFVPPDHEREQAEVAGDPSACQLGHLSAIVSHVPEMRRFDTLVFQMKALRNELAHGRPASFLDAAELRRVALDLGAWPGQ
jgi:hypothetical protein